MFWNDIEEIKEGLGRLEMRIDILDGLVRKCVDRASIESCFPIREGAPMCIRCDGDRVVDAAVEDIRDLLCDVFSSEDENNTINRLHDKLNVLLSDATRAGEVLVAEKTLDKFEDYMKNVDKLNAMINEFKGCVALARGALEDRKAIEHKDLEYNLAVMTAANILKDETRSKIDYIYENMPKIADLLHKHEKKPRKKKKAIKKKKAVSPAH